MKYRRYRMVRPNETELQSMGAAWLLPIVACVVAAASGSVVAEVLPHPQYALGTLVASYILWGVGVPFALMVMTIYLMRLMLHKLPAKVVIVSTFLPLGPLGQGGYGYAISNYYNYRNKITPNISRIQKLGSVSRTVFPLTRTLRPGSGDTLYDVGFLLGLFLWAFGSLWLFFAAASIIRSKKFPFNLGWWAFTFPLGVYSTCTCQLGREMPSRFFAVLGTVCYPDVYFDHDTDFSDPVIERRASLAHSVSFHRERDL